MLPGRSEWSTMYKRTMEGSAQAVRVAKKSYAISRSSERHKKHTAEESTQAAEPRAAKILYGKQ